MRCHVQLLHSMTSGIFGVLDSACVRAFLPRSFASMNNDHACGFCCSLIQPKISPCSVHQGTQLHTDVQSLDQGKWLWIADAISVDRTLIFHDAHDASSSAVLIMPFWFQICVKGFFISWLFLHLQPLHILWMQSDYECIICKSVQCCNRRYS